MTELLGGIFILFLFIVVFVALNIYIYRDYLVARLLLMALIYICLLLLLKSSYLFYFGILLAFVGPVASVIIFFRPALMQNNLKKIQHKFFKDRPNGGEASASGAAGAGAEAGSARPGGTGYARYGNQGPYRAGESAGQGRQATPPSRQQPDPYEVLGVTRDMSNMEIRQVFKELVHIYHPDKGKIKSPAKFIALKEAYETIMRQRNFYKS